MFIEGVGYGTVLSIDKDGNYIVRIDFSEKDVTYIATPSSVSLVNIYRGEKIFASSAQHVREYMVARTYVNGSVAVTQKNGTTVILAPFEYILFFFFLFLFCFVLFLFLFCFVFFYDSCVQNCLASSDCVLCGFMWLCARLSALCGFCALLAEF